MVVTTYVAKISDRRSEVNCPLAFEARPCLQVSRTCGQGGDNIVSGDGSANALKFKLPNRLDGHSVFNCHQNARTDQYLTGLRFVAQTRCDVANRAYGSIVEASLKADGPQRSETMRNADAEAEANVVPEVDATSPSVRQ